MSITRFFALVTALDSSLGISPVIGKKENEGIIELSSRFERLHELSHVPVDFLDHGGIDRHHVIIAIPLPALQ